MLLGYLTAAMERAHYEIIEDEEPFYGEVPGLQGVWEYAARRLDHPTLAA